MAEQAPELTPGQEREKRKAEYVRLAEVLSENLEGFPFPGIDPEAYSLLKEAEVEDPGYMTPLDERLKKFQEQGIRIVLSKHRESGMAFVIPAINGTIEEDSLAPRYLKINPDVNDDLRKLILANRQ
ncbi:MAG: hypothetical protein V4480_03420 [Patescibacteria group bacterium]